MQPATGPIDKSGVFKVENNYGAMCIGVNAKLGGAWSPIYLSQTPFATGVISLTPIEKVLIWFDASSSTGTMLVDAVTNSIEVGRCIGVKCCLCTDLRSRRPYRLTSLARRRKVSLMHPPPISQAPVAGSSVDRPYFPPPIMSRQTHSRWRHLAHLYSQSYQTSSILRTTCR